MTIHVHIHRYRGAPKSAWGEKLAEELATPASPRSPKLPQEDSHDQAGADFECARDEVYPSELPQPIPVSGQLQGPSGSRSRSPPQGSTPRSSPRLRLPTPTRQLRPGAADPGEGLSASTPALGRESQSRLAPPSKIPKPSVRASPKPSAPGSQMLEDLDDQQLLKLTSMSRPISSSPLPNAPYVYQSVDSRMCRYTRTHSCAYTLYAI